MVIIKAIVLLQSILEDDMYINKKIKEVYELRTLLNGEGVRYDKDKVQTSTKGDSLSDIVVKIIDLETEIDRLVDEFYSKKIEIQKLMYMIGNEKIYELLYSKYFNYDSLYGISRKNNEKYSTVKKRHKKSLKEMQKVLDIVYNK